MSDKAIVEVQTLHRLANTLRDIADELDLLVPWGPATMASIEKRVILEALDRNEGSAARAAEELGISVRKVQYRRKQYQMELAG